MRGPRLRFMYHQMTPPTMMIPTMIHTHGRSAVVRHRLRDVLERIGPDSVGQTATLSIVHAGQPASVQVTIVERHVA